MLVIWKREGSDSRLPNSARWYSSCPGVARTIPRVGLFRKTLCSPQGVGDPSTSAIRCLLALNTHSPIVSRFIVKYRDLAFNLGAIPDSRVFPLVWVQMSINSYIFRRKSDGRSRIALPF